MVRPVARDNRAHRSPADGTLDALSSVHVAKARAKIAVREARIGRFGPSRQLTGLEKVPIGRNKRSFLRGRIRHNSFKVPSLRSKVQGPRHRQGIRNVEFKT